MDRIFEWVIKLGLLAYAIYFFLLLHREAEKRIAEAKPRDRYFYLAHIYLFLFKLIVGGGFIVFTYGPAIGVLYLIYRFIVYLVS